MVSRNGLFDCTRSSNTVHLLRTAPSRKALTGKDDGSLQQAAAVKTISVFCATIMKRLRNVQNPILTLISKNATNRIWEMMKILIKPEMNKEGKSWSLR